MNEYEISGIENIARGVCVVGGKVLLCRGKGLSSTYLPGGHIEFGEKGREALVREMREETGLAAEAGELLGVVESSFEQKGRKHCEINLIYSMPLDSTSVTAQEDWIAFDWIPLADLDKVNLLPPEMKKYIRVMV